MVGAVPSSCTLQAKFRVVDFVIDVLFETVISSIHPSNVGVALHVHADRGVEGVGVIDGDTGVVDNDEVAVSPCACVFVVGAALNPVSGFAWCEGWVVVHLGIGVQD